jgi:hypothetical protein
MLGQTDKDHHAARVGTNSRPAARLLKSSRYVAGDPAGALHALHSRGRGPTDPERSRRSTHVQRPHAWASTRHTRDRDRHLGKVNSPGALTWGFPRNWRLSRTSFLPTSDGVFPRFPTSRGLAADLAQTSALPQVGELDDSDGHWPSRRLRARGDPVNQSVRIGADELARRPFHRVSAPAGSPWGAS